MEILGFIVVFLTGLYFLLVFFYLFYTSELLGGGSLAILVPLGIALYLFYIAYHFSPFAIVVK